MFGLFTVSYASEIGQAYLSTTRIPDPRDLVANGLGIVAGLLAGAFTPRLATAARRPQGSARARPQP